jgi:predicted small integral membrane protein
VKGGVNPSPQHAQLPDFCGHFPRVPDCLRWDCAVPGISNRIEKRDSPKMARPLPSKTERLVRAFLLLITSAFLTFVAWSIGLYKSQDSTKVAIAILVIVVIAVLVSRFCAKTVMRLFGWNP